MIYKLKQDELIIKGESVFLVPLTLDDCTERYLNWLQDPLINRYLETRWVSQSLESIKQFVANMIDDPRNYLFAIRELITEQHIGNIKLGPINTNHSYADISYFIGERRVWGKGLATEAIKLVTQFAFKQLGLHRLQAGLYAENMGSSRALEKAGYQFEAVFKQQLRLETTWEDHLWYSIFNECVS